MGAMTGLPRRRLLAAGAAWLATPGLLHAAEPRPRPSGFAGALAGSGLGPLTGAVVVDAATGEILEAHRAGVGQPPASVAKVVTALYGLDSLGPDYRFRTRVLGRGPVEGGVLRGDLVLEGGGDPLLDTDALGGLVQALRAAGLTGISGRFLVTNGALPGVEMIAPGQPEDAAYNPAVSGLNLNFNRVFLSWVPGAPGPDFRFSAPGDGVEAPVGSVTGELVAAGPLRRRAVAGGETWSLPRGGLGSAGSLWLPVRAPAAYGGEVFRGLAGQAGIELLEPQVRAAAPGAVMTLRDGPRLEAMLHGMLKYSTNLTAEVVGLRAGQARGFAPDGLAASAAAMTDWARTRFGLVTAEFANHSGLSGRTRISAADMAALLVQAQDLGLPTLLKPRPILDAARQPLETGVTVVAKTGTMDFISGLAGYMTGDRRLAFAIFAADPARRDAIRPDQRDNPPGAAAWAARARAQEQALLRRWAAEYA
jgi:D-alanyl-D-alanine carboxypeptidase/D-alanyl-D-alanine-endopeptidase (penicillin-binding protein 4)